MRERAQVNPELRKLLSLQDIEKNISALKNEVSEIPFKTGEFEATAQRIKDTYEGKAAKIQELAILRRALEGDVDLARIKLSRLKDQLMTVKTNKEYTAMLSEIKIAETHIKDMEDRILDLMEALESSEAETVRVKTEMCVESDSIKEEIRLLNEKVPVLEGKLGKLYEEKAVVEAGVGAELLAQYRIIADSHKGIALAEAKDELCSACHIRIRPQMYTDLLRTEAIMLCDSCSRILFVNKEAQ